MHEPHSSGVRRITHFVRGEVVMLGLSLLPNPTETLATPAKLNVILMICFVVTYSWYHIRSNEVLSKNEEEVATKRSMKNLKMAMHRQR